MLEEELKMIHGILNFRPQPQGLKKSMRGQKGGLEITILLLRRHFPLARGIQ